MLNKKTIAFLSVIVLISGSLIISGSSCGNNPIGVKASTSTTTPTTPTSPTTPTTFTLTSLAFTNKSVIPDKYTKIAPNGKNISLPLSWTNTPEGTKSFVLLMRDLFSDDYIHWAVINIPSGATSISEDASRTNNMPQGSKELNNAFIGPGYMGPEPLFGSHIYQVTLYALNTASLNLSDDVKLADFNNSIGEKIISLSTLEGYYPTIPVSFSNEVQTIFNDNCLNCHGSTASKGLDLRAGSSRSNLINRSLVNKGDDTNSVLIKRLEANGLSIMPPSGAISTASIQKIKNWIIEGLNDN